MIGVDIEDIERFKNKSQKFLDRIFTENEQIYCKSFLMQESHLAVRFCAKEAVVKALSGYGIKNIHYKEIEIFHDENKCPKVRILKEISQNIVFEISLSHDRNKAIAFVTSHKTQRNA